MRQLIFLCFLLFTADALAQHQVTFIVHDHSPILREEIYISGSFNNWDSLANPAYRLIPEGKGVHRIRLTMPAGSHEYKFTGGNWKSVERNYFGEDGVDRNVVIRNDTAITAAVHQWRDLVIPSSRQLLSQSTPDSARIKALVMLARIFSIDPLYYQPDSALLYFQEITSQFNQFELREKAEGWPNYPEWKTSLLYFYSVYMRSIGNFPKSLELQLAALQFKERSADSGWIADAYKNVASEYLNMNDYANALRYAQRSLDLMEAGQTIDTVTLQYNQSEVHLQIALAYYSMGQHEQSMEHARAACLYEYPPQVHALTLIGDLFRDTQPDSAKWYYRKSLTVASQTQLSAFQWLAHKGLALVFREKNMLDSARYHASQAMDIIRKNKSNFKSAGFFPEGLMAEITPLIGEIFYALGKPDSAYKYLHLSVALKDSVFNLEKIRAFQNLTFNESVRKQHEEQKLREEQQRLNASIKTYAFVAGLFVLAVFAFFQYRNSKQKHATNLILGKQKSDLEETLTQLKQTQSQLVQSEKMASLGELTAGIAHEIQNPLNFVNNFSEINVDLIDELRSELATGNMQLATEVTNTIRENENKILFHGKRADAIVKGMLQHSRTSSGVKEPTDINALADEYLRLAFHGLRAKEKSFNATMKTDFDPTIGLINVVPQDIGRVILNLITNAFHAVTLQPPIGGDLFQPTVTVKTKLLPPTGGKGVETKGALVEISISDNGPGIPSENLDKIFQPFFTTKPTGQGTGLGLSLSYDIIKAHGGEIGVDSLEGEGTTFTITLPIHPN